MEDSEQTATNPTPPDAQYETLNPNSSPTDNEPSSFERVTAAISAEEQQSDDQCVTDEDERDENQLATNAANQTFGLQFTVPDDAEIFRLRRDSRRRACQSRMYENGLETRIRFLEQKINEVLQLDQEELARRPSPPREHALVQEIVYYAQVSYRSWNQWVLPPPACAPPWSIVEALVERPQSASTVNLSGRFRRRFTRVLPPSAPQGDREIERIRLNSPHLHTFFKDVMGEAAPGVHAVLLSPFKPLLVYVDDLKECISAVQGELEMQSSKSCDPVQESAGDGSKQGNTPSGLDTSAPSTSAAKGGEDATFQDQKRDGEITEGEPQYGPEREPQVAEEMLEHLQCLLGFVEENFSRNITRMNDLRKGNATQVAFQELWSLFAPGDVVYDRSSKQAFRLYHVCGGRRALTRHSSRPPPMLYGDTPAPVDDDIYTAFILDCFHISFDGEELGPITHRERIPSYDGEVAISSLPLVPIKFEVTGRTEHGHSDTTRLEEHLADRGRRYHKLIDPKQVAHRDYVGFSLGNSREQVDSQVIVDPGLLFDLSPNERPQLGLQPYTSSDDREYAEYKTCDCMGCNTAAPETSYPLSRNLHIYDESRLDRRRSDVFRDNTKLLRRIRDVNKVLDHDQLILLPATVPGYVLRSRKWLILDVEKIFPITTRAQNFKDLILPDGHKTLVEGLVRTHSKSGKSVAASKDDSSDEAPTNLVRGKGKGVIILLHGVPGVGKTSTAECVAEYTERPLFSITCGDIGQTPSEVQDNLELNFQLAHRWGCVMLLDEADVFLQQRNKVDMKRNAVVSVFLRILEYYSGILFLTTNKVGNFDEAFKSRIHISLYYAPLSRDQSKEIWKMNLRRVADHNPDLAFDRQDILDWARSYMRECEEEGRRPWNGRQIYNACQTAVAIAQFQGKGKMTERHFDTVAEASKQFDEYLEEVHGGDDAAVAKRLSYRHDDALYEPLPNLDAEWRVSARDYPRSRRGGGGTAFSYQSRDERGRLTSDRPLRRAPVPSTDYCLGEGARSQTYGDESERDRRESPSPGTRRRLRRENSIRDR